MRVIFLPYQDRLTPKKRDHPTPPEILHDMAAQFWQDEDSLFAIGANYDGIQRRVVQFSERLRN